VWLWILQTLKLDKESKSSTAQKKKLRLKERKLKRQGKLKKSGNDSENIGWEEVRLLLRKVCVIV
jgi:hypothetical protein